MKTYYIEYITENIKEKKYISLKNKKELFEYCEKNNYILYKYKTISIFSQILNTIFLRKKEIKKTLNDYDSYLIIKTLYIITYAEIPSNRRLKYMIKSINSKKLEPLIVSFNDAINDGVEISKALKAIGLSDYIIYSVKVGSETGEVLEIYQKILEVLKNKIDTRQKMKKLLRNPLIYLTLLFGMFQFYIFFYYQRIKDLLKYMDSTKFPPVTNLFLSWSDYAVSSPLHAFIFIFASTTIFLSTIYLVSKLFKNLIKFIPGLKNILIYEDYIIFFSLLNVALSSNIMLFKGIQLATEALNNYNLKKNLLNAVEKIEDGMLFSEITIKDKLFNDDFECEAAIANFEETKETKHFEILVEMQKEKLDNIIDIVSAFIQPILLIVVLAFIVLFQYAANAPMWNFGS